MPDPVFYYDEKRPVDLICMGRVAVDLYAEQIGFRLADVSGFKKYLGGCAGNIAVGSARLGLNCQMFSCVGADEMGVFLKQELLNEGVNLNLLSDSTDHLTALVLLGISPPNEFPLMFYRTDCADMQLEADHILTQDLKQAKAILMTGTALSTQAMRTTSIAVAQKAREAETAVVFDLDFRPVLWGLTSVGNGETRFLPCKQVSETYQQFLPFCDLIVGTEEELCIAGGCDSIDDSLQVIRRFCSAPIVIKLGEQGAKLSFAHSSTLIHSASFPVEVLNVLGAGDAFMSGLLKGLLRGESWLRACELANANGALVVTRHGCAPAMAYQDELDYFISQYAHDPRVWQSAELATLHDKNQPRQTDVVLKKPKGFTEGVNTIVTMDSSSAMGMGFHSLKLNRGQVHHFNPQYEFAALLMTGKVQFHYDGLLRFAERTDYFAQAPIVLHCPADQLASVQALSDAELLLIETENATSFAPMLFDKTNMIELDERGKGLLEDSAFRIVRTVFDKRNRPESNLVVGEIVSMPGRWSSFPSHQHPQPEIYHYRFSEPQGFAFAEHGKDVLRIEHFDTYQIGSGKQHAHCTAPGYALYTLWFIRHLPDNPYQTPIFSQEHEWTKGARANNRVWSKK